MFPVITLAQVNNGRILVSFVDKVNIDCILILFTHIAKKIMYFYF